jgi:DnaJ-class molecular chaperone
VRGCASPIRDAASYWNSFATALVALRRKTERKATQAAIAARCTACAGSGEDFNEGDVCLICNGTGKATT